MFHILLFQMKNMTGFNAIEINLKTYLYDI